MAKAFKSQSPAVIERNRLRRIKRDNVFKAICLNHRPRVPKGTARKLARSDIAAWKQRRKAKQQQQRGELPQQQPALKSVMRTIEQQVEE